MKFIFIWCIIFYGTNIYALFNYDRAIKAGQDNNWARSADLLKNVLVEKENRPTYSMILA